MRKPRILIIENSIDVTGALKSITRTAYDLNEYFDFQFIIPKKSRGRSWIVAKGFSRVFELPMREISRRFLAIVQYVPLLFINALRLKYMVRRDGISLLHVNDLYNLLPVMYLWLGGQKPYVCHIRFLPERFPKVLLDFWLGLHIRYAYKIIAVSHAVARQLPKHEKIVVIHNELPVEERYPELTAINPDKSSFRFLYLSNFIKGKGQNYALEAFGRIHHQLPDWKLRFVGSDMGLFKNKAYREKLVSRAKEIGIFEKTEWVGFTEEVEWEYKHADVILNFSESESFSITCLEALYYSRPVIASDCGGPAEIIENGRTGYLVKNMSVDAMAQAMMKFAADTTLSESMGKEARRLVTEKFSIENTSFKLLLVYREILHK